jgi:alpha-mannosidase
VVNPTSFARADLAWWGDRLPPGRRLLRADGTAVPTQGGEGGTWIAAGPLAPFSATSLLFGDGEPPPCEEAVFAAPDVLQNNLLRVELDSAGDIIRIHDKAHDREVLPRGEVANVLQAFEDRPLNWDAWDIDVFFDDRYWTSEPTASVEVVEAGPLRATLQVRRRILHSDYVQRLSLSSNSPRLDIETKIDWRERHVLLKVAFPVDVLSPMATHEIQWGNVERPTHRNTSWDWARFETCAQKWVDLSEGDYGVSLLNDSKYGHDIRDNVLRMSLLRSPTMPDPEADQGEHEFVYSLLPHGGRVGGDTVAAAYALNDPLVVFGAGRRPKADSPVAGLSLLSVDRPGVVVETVKWAEDGDGVIVRLYESQRRRGKLELSTGFPVAKAWRTNLLEENQDALELDGRRVALSIRPYEIITMRLVPARGQP